MVANETPKTSKIIYITIIYKQEYNRNKDTKIRADTHCNYSQDYTYIHSENLVLVLTQIHIQFFPHFSAEKHLLIRNLYRRLNLRYLIKKKRFKI